MLVEYCLSTSRVKSLRTGKAMVTESAAVFSIEGPGALSCLQVRLTCDLNSAAESSLHYGALLTPKGMIVVDPWVVRDRDRLTLVVPAAAREPTLQLLGRVLPPRLARTTDLSDAWGVLWLLGSCALERFARANAIELPAPLRVAVAGN